MYSKAKLCPIYTNETLGQYRPKFFDLEEYGLDEVTIESEYFSESDITQQIAEQEYSFVYLRENKLRKITAKKDGRKIPFEDFCKHFGIVITSENIFKTGKYLSRIFRPVRYGGYFEGLNIHENTTLQGKVIDGISIISEKLARDLGWKEATSGKSAQFTLFFQKGLVKGHCVVSDKISHDVIIYQENIKTEIKYNFKDLAYITIEPVKLSSQLRLDIQTMLNIWEGFGQEEFFDWTIDATEKFFEDLKQGRVTEWLDNFDEYETEEDIEEEQWKLKKAILHGIDYRKFPALIRSAWSMFKSSLIRIAEDKDGNPKFRIPILGGMRGYIRPDLRNHDADGNFSLTERKVTVDNFGNVWISGESKEVEEVLSILGGADFDDSVGIIPLEGSKALLFRNPNQKGEYIIEDVVFDKVEVKKCFSLKGKINQKKVSQVKKEQQTISNKLIEKYLQALGPRYAIKYSPVGLIRTYHRISTNSTSIGYVANAEMIRSAIGIINKSLMEELIKKYPWDLERVIDSTVKDGISCDEDIRLVNEFYTEIATSKIPIPSALMSRIPERFRNEITTAKHPLDELFEAMKFVIEDMDVKIVGKGAVGKDRISGWIDTIEAPLFEIMAGNEENPMTDVAIKLLKGYNTSVAELMTKRKSVFDDITKELSEIQINLLKALSQYSDDERKMMIKIWAEEIYKTEKHVHDSILWIGDKEGLKGTVDDMIDMLADCGLALHIKKNGTLKRYIELKKTELPIKSIRLWRKEEISILPEGKEIMILERKALLGDSEFNLGEECDIKDGIYRIKEITPAYSKKTNARLKNSITVLIEIN